MLKGLFIGLLVFLVLLVGFFYPKKAYFNQGDGACFADRCLGFRRNTCLPNTTFSANNCHMTCYGYVYNKCDNRYIPIYFVKRLGGIFGLKWGLPVSNIIR